MVEKIDEKDEIAKLSFVEFVKTYWKDSEVTINPHFLAFVDEIEKNNPKNISHIIHHGRGFNFDGYKYNLVETAKALLSGKNVILATETKNPYKFIQDMNRYLNLEVIIEKTDNPNCFKLKLIE